MDNTLMWLDQYVAKTGTPADGIRSFSGSTRPVSTTAQI